MHWSIYWAAVIITFVLGWYCTEKNLQAKGKSTVQRVLGAWFTTSVFATIQIVCFLLDSIWLDLVGFVPLILVLISLANRLQKTQPA